LIKKINRKISKIWRNIAEAIEEKTGNVKKGQKNY
jgi:hypothetical protein